MNWGRTITVDIDIDDVIGEIDTSDLIGELKTRNLKGYDLSDLGGVNGLSLKDIITQWLKDNNMSPLWVYSDEEISKIVLSEIHKQ